MIEGMGRGVFATEDLTEDRLLVVEKAVAEHT